MAELPPESETPTTARTKRPLSEKELAARRANAQRSTGPRNTEKTRFNGLKHGLLAQVEVLRRISDEVMENDSMRTL